MPRLPSEGDAAMKTKMLVVALSTIVAAPSAHAHLLNGLNLDVSKTSAHRSARVIHDVFSKNKHAHEAQRIVACESRFRVKAKNGAYWGLFQMDSGTRDAYDWGWTRRKQTRAAHKLYLERGWSPWSGCT
jgi:hypothetical protein